MGTMIEPMMRIMRVWTTFCVVLPEKLVIITRELFAGAAILVATIMFSYVLIVLWLNFLQGAGS